MDIYLFWVIIQCYFCFDAQIVLVLPIESSLGWFLCLFDIPPLLWWCFMFFNFCFWVFIFLSLVFIFVVVLSTSLLSCTEGVLGLSCIFPILALEQAISPKNPGSIYWRILLETKIWVLNVFLGTGVFLLLGPFS